MKHTMKTNTTVELTKCQTSLTALAALAGSNIKLIGPVLSLLLITGNLLAASVPEQIAALQSQISALQTTVADQAVLIADLSTRDAAQAAQITTLQGQVSDLAPKLQYVSVSGTEMFITGANLHLLSGSGATDGAKNGLGNLIVGYNELRNDETDDRTGSHNIVVGKLQSYSSYGGLVAGVHNTISGIFSSVSGGQANIASGNVSSVSGGVVNTASGNFAAVSGGAQNIASANSTSVSGGEYNTASGNNSASVSGGQFILRGIEFSENSRWGTIGLCEQRNRATATVKKMKALT